MVRAAATPTGREKVTVLNERESGKNREIEILRAVAITYVVASHWVPHFLGRFGSLGQAFQRYTATWSGVDLFFCISGYVIARSMLTASRALAASGSNTSFASLAAPFWIRRIFRLWPSAWLWAVIPVILSVTWNRNGFFGGTGPAVLDAVMAILNVENLHYYKCLRTETCGPLGVYWSLSLEEQFYWIFPFLLLLLRRRALVVGLVALAAIQIVLPRANAFSADPSLLWLIRTDAICVGILLALFEPQTKILATPYILATPLRARAVTLALLVILAIAPAPAFGFTRATGILALVSGALVWIARFDRGLILPRSRLDPILLWVGSRSYSLYLIHAVAGGAGSELRDRIVGVTPQTGHWLGVAVGVLCTVGLALGLSELNFRFVETPLRLVGRRVSHSLNRGPGHEVARVPG
jgi:peptidoglycan/LPS O-acetylase OafA/YrhL